MSDNTIGRALRTRRALLGLDQRDAATRIGMSRTTYSSYERDTQRPSVDVLPAIADFIDISIDDVLVLFGASAIAAARTALGRARPTASAEMSAPSNEPESRDDFTGSHGDADAYMSTNGVSHHDEMAESAAGAPATYVQAEPAESSEKTHAKAHDEREKGKKKKKKKDKREKLVNPAFATHV
jgi:transcriptional regulator with XRE-family HTH domain